MQYYKQYIIWLPYLYDYKNGITRQKHAVWTFHHIGYAFSAYTWIS